MEREKEEFKGKLLSEKRIKVFLILNSFLFVGISIIVIERIINKKYYDILDITPAFIMLVYNFYTLDLNIKEKKRLREHKDY